MSSLLYGLDDRPGPGRTLLYVLQWFGYMLANVAVVPLVVGPAFGLGPAEVAALSGRTFLITGAVSALQVLFGHHLPLVEAPAGIWWAVLIQLATVAGAGGFAHLGPALETAMIVTGAVTALLGFTGGIGRLIRGFTPAVTGTVLVLLALQLSGTFLKGVLGITAGHPQPDGALAAISTAVLGVVVAVTLYGPGLTRSFGVLAGLVVGAVLSAALGRLRPVAFGAWVGWPQPFAWGRPAFDAGVTLVAVVTGLVVLTNLVASLYALGQVVGRQPPERAYNRAAVLTGLADALAGVFPAVGYVPYTSSAGVVAMSGVAARRPFLWASLLFAALGFLPAVGALFASLPPAVGYAVTMASFSQILAFGLRDYARLRFTPRDVFVVGLAVLTGSGVMFLDPATFAGAPPILRNLLSNGLIVGLALAALFDHVILRERPPAPERALPRSGR
ncbi:MAG: purine/pyrimidine permease [Firmicutes bacterium]|nr:purine/pyrimidine permease [Bacillota bacterium]